MGSADTGARLRILNVISTGEEAGGAESHVALVNDALRERGHVVRTLASDLATGSPRFDDRTFPAVATHGLKKLLSSSWNRHAAAAVKHELRTFVPDVVVVHTMHQLTPAVLFAVRNVPTIVCIHGPEHFIRSLLSWFLSPFDASSAASKRQGLTLRGRTRWTYFRLFSDPLYRLGLRSAERLVTFSASWTALMASEGIATTYLQMGVSLFPPAPLDPDDHVVLYAGRIEVTKGVNVLLSAFEEVHRAIPDARLRIAGSGAAADDLRHRITSAGLDDHVEMIGHVPAGAMPAFYASGSVTVVPSFAEAFGKVGPEAMSVGRPVVAAPVGGILEWLRPEVNGLAFANGDASALARALIRLLRDPVLLSSLARGALATAPQFAISGHVDRFEELLREIVAESAAGRPGGAAPERCATPSKQRGRPQAVR